jgi:hypothetical protein
MMSALAVRWTPRSLSDVMAYHDEPLLVRYAERRGVSVDEARRHFEGLKQFLFVCAAMPGTHTPSDAMAGMWRSFLLSTKEYRQFCHGYLGRFIDHTTVETPSGEAYLVTRRAAEGVLGRLDDELWPMGGDSASHDASGADG